MTIEFLKPGMQTSLQDYGFTGQMQNGVAKAGAMDQLAMELANWLVSKPKHSAVLEITLIGPKIKFSSALQIAICGACFDCKLNNKKIQNNLTINIQAGDILEFGKLINGSRAYLAFTGIPQQEAILNSYSTNLSVGFGNNCGNSFKKNDVFKIKKIVISPNRKLPKALHLVYGNHVQLRTIAGVDADLFDKENSDLFYSQAYQVTADSNRMGLRLKSKSIKIAPNHSMTSAGISQGTIQIPVSGQPIITSVEGQTIGGYPRIANIIKADLDLLGQLKTNDRINFQRVDVIQSQQLWKQKVALFSLK